MTDPTTSTPEGTIAPVSLQGELMSVASFIPAKVRVVIYTAAGAIALGAFAAGEALHGTPHVVVEGIGAAAALVASVTAISHVSS